MLKLLFSLHDVLHSVGVAGSSKGPGGNWAGPRDFMGQLWPYMFQGNVQSGDVKAWTWDLLQVVQEQALFYWATVDIRT